MTDDPAFAYPFAYWVGMDTDPRTSSEALAEFNRFYSTTHVGEVIAAHPGFVTASRWELVEQDPRGGAHAGPRWLAVYEMQDEAAAERYVKDNERPGRHRRKYSSWPSARKRAKTVWRLLWRKISGSSAPADSVVLLGTNTPAPEARASIAQFELYRAYAHPAPSAPRYCTIYAADGSGAPPEGDDLVWRLVYRRIPPP